VKKDWEIKKLGEVCEVIAGQSPEGKFYNQDKKGTPFYQGKKDFGLKYLDKPTVWTTVETKIALENDILMSVRAPVGDINICTSRVCIGRGLAAIRASEAVNNDFLFYFLLSIKSKITGKEGAVFASINRQEISDLAIPIPSLEEQKRIVKILNEKFAQLETIKTNAQTNLQNAKDLFQSQLTKAFSNTTWEKKTIGDICILKSGNSSSNNSKPGNLPYVKVGDMTINGNEKTITTSTLFVDYEENKKNIFPKGTVIFPKRGGAILTNKKRLTAVEICCDLNIMGVIPTDKILSEFLYYYFIGIDFAELCNGAAIPQINNIDINPLTISLPPLPEQKRIVKELDTLSEKVRQLEEIYTKQLTDCDELKQSLLQKAFEGEL
jgi:type I restriction enzyme S subunit